MSDRDDEVIEIMARAMAGTDNENAVSVPRAVAALVLDALRAAGYTVKSDGVARTDQHLAEDYRRLLGDLFTLRDEHVRKSIHERAEADDSGVGGFSVNAAWAAARQEFAADLQALIWGEQPPTVAPAGTAPDGKEE